MIRRKTPLKRKTYLKSGGPIKKKPVSAQVKAERKQQYEDDWAFYRKIWSDRPHICAVCRTFLGGEIKNYFFDHLLEKSTYPELRYVEENIALVCYECHGCKTNGHPREKHVELIEQAKQKLLNDGTGDKGDTPESEEET